MTICDQDDVDGYIKQVGNIQSALDLSSLINASIMFVVAICCAILVLFFKRHL